MRHLKPADRIEDDALFELQIDIIGSGKRLFQGERLAALAVYPFLGQLFLQHPAVGLAHGFGTDLAVPDTDNAVNNAGDIAIVADDDAGKVEASIQLAQELPDLVRCNRIYLAGRFIGQQDLGLVGQCDGNSDALLLATGKLCQAMVAVAQ